jgi:ubiquinone/menaquinone biosynthesis C-methylase UbiE
MGHHTFDASRADSLEDAAHRYKFLSAEELLWALDPVAGDTVADLGSGTGFYTDDIAPHAETVYAIDIQAEMHEYYREKGVPANVELVTSGVSDLPFPSDSLDGAVSTMTYHEFATTAALDELRRVLSPEGTVAIVDWAASGSGEHGPPLAERFAASEAVDKLRDSGFVVEHTAVRPETFLLVAGTE